jgi:cytochrome P450
MDAETLATLEHVPEDFMQRPYEVLEEYRRRGPVHHIVFPHGAAVWLITKYDDVRNLLADPRVCKDGRRMNELFVKQSGLPDTEEGVGFDDELSQHMLNSDAPRHTRLRSLVSKAFTLRQMENYRSRMGEVVDELLAQIEGKQEIEMVGEFALPLVINVICDVLGIPNDDRETFRRWAVELVGAGQPPEVVEAASKNVMAYSERVIDDKTENPADDLISGLIKGRDDQGDKLTRQELVAMIFLFTVAGHVTSMHTIANAVHSLLTHPDQFEKLKADMSIMPRAIDELMRFDSAVAVATFRFTGDEVTVGGQTIPEGEILALSLSSAHRDDDRFPDGNALDLDRKPNGVLGFGHGPHFCIGQPLAKIQTEIALTKLFTRYPHMTMLTPSHELRWESSTLLRGPITLPIALNG